MKRIFKSILGAAMLLSASTLTAMAQEPSEGPLWMRYSAISPDGSTIAFAYKGDIFTVPVSGGEARQITSNAAFDSRPVWSPDGSRIAFVSYRMGGADVFIVSKEGGEPTRLTTHSAGEFPVAFKDDSTVLYSAYIQPAAESMQFPSSTFSQIYAVSTEGGRPVMFSTLPLENISFSPDGTTLLYNDKKGYEDEWRKHHTSSIARDIWSCKFEGDNVNEGVFTKITTFDGEDRDPVYAPDGKSFYYLSEQDGTFNVWKRSLADGSDVQITRFAGNPVRFLTVAKNGTLCFGYDGEIYTVTEGAEPRKVNIEIIADKQDRNLIKQPVYYANEIAVSKDGKQVAFIYRGDVYVTMTDYATTKRITNTAEQERDIDFAPDGRSLIYSSERDGLWQVYRASIVNDDEKLFPYCSEIKEERVTNSDVPSFQPLFSPDGKEVAFLENRTTIRVINLDSKEVRTVMDGKYEYSYSDGDQWYQWSPDGKWILSNCIFEGGWNNKDVALINASGNGEMHDLTQSGYTDANAKWVLDGKAMIWFSDRAGYRSHGSWGAESDVYIMFFDLEAYEKFRMSEEELALYEEEQKIKDVAEEKAAADDKKSGKDKKSKKGEQKEEEETEPLKLDLDNSEYRVMRLTVNSSNLGDAVLSKDGNKLYYITSFEGGMDLWVHDLKENTTTILSKGVGYGSLILSDDGKNIFMNTGRIKKIDVGSGKITPVEIEGVFEYKPYAERQYMFDHAWRQVKEKFYDPEIHGVDWDGYKAVYEKFLPYINNNFDFAEMLGEMLGELNGSHTGARYYGGGASYPTAYLGVFYDDTYEGDGLKIKEIIKRSPLTQIPNDVKAGCIIEKIDGEPVLAGQDYFPLLEGKVGKKIRLTVYDPVASKRFDVEIKGLGSEGGILYQRWVERNREIVDSISGGKIGYVHIQGMDSPSFRTLYSELLGRLRQKDAVVVDTRHNGGGWLHDDVVTLLSGKEYQQFRPRGQYIGSDPFNKWLKPSCMLVCEDNYSNAHGTPWVYKRLAVGKLVGAPVPGTMTAVWWESQIDNSIVFGIPQVGCWDIQKEEYMENVELQPDILIYNDPADVVNGYDAQLKAATESLMEE